MPSSTANAVEQYIAAMRLTRGVGAQTAETTFYTPLANFFNAVGAELKPRVHFQAHPGSHGAGIVDGGFYPLQRARQSEPLPGQRPERGTVEIKPVGTDMNTLARSVQVRRYLDNYGLCLITNFHQFQLLELRHGQPYMLEAYDLAATAEAFWSQPLRQLVDEHAETLPDYLQRVMTRKVPLEKPKDVASLLASYAREARARAVRHPLAAFAGVKSALQEALGITFEGEKGENFFLSTLIQTLFYGIFSAWVLWRRTPEGRAPGATFNWRLSADYLRIPVLRALFHAISERGALNTVQIMEVLDHANDALNRVEPAFFQTFNEEDAVNYFYEPFLQAFDPELRKQLGVWYTPREIVRYMVERVDHLLRTELHEPLGLASPNVQVLDPCCGTGAYLVEVLHRIERTLREQAGDDSNYVGSDLRKAATTRVFGFEIMPAPFVIAHLQVAHLLEEAGASLPEHERAKVFLTNALTGWVPAKHPQSDFGFPAFMKERDEAEAVKQADTILVILGNPPYNGYAGIAQKEERDLSTAYSSHVEGLPAPQGQGLNDLYIRFFRIAERRITQNRERRGIACFISNYSWLDGLSHPTMRHHMLHNFDDVYVDNLHGDRRISEYAPDGRTSETVMAMQGSSVGIKVGTAIATMVKSGNPVQQGTLQYRDFAAARAEERRANLFASVTEDTYSVLTPNPTLGLPFKPRVVTTAYLDWPRLPELFPTSFPGIKTSRDALLVDIDRDRLERRMQTYLSSSVSDEAIRRDMPDVMENSARFDASETRRLVQKRGFRGWQIVRYAYRPFDVRWLYWEPTTKLLDEKREDYLQQLVGETVWIEARQRESGTAFCRGTVTSALGDNFGNGLSNFFPLDVLGKPSLINAAGATEFNISGWLDRFIARNFIVDEPTTEGIERTNQRTRRLTVSPSWFFFHALATMHTPQYRTENAGALLGDWPRIPLPATAELLTHSAGLGRRLAELLDPESDVRLQAEWSFLARLVLPPELPEGAADRDRRNAARFAVTAGWGGRGQGETVMPRRGKAPERDWTPTELDRLRTLAAMQALSEATVLELLGGRCVDVHLNGDANWAAVPQRVWEYTLGGYQVLKKWLSYREEPLLGRPLHEDETRYFAQVVRRVAAILLMGPALDASYAAILPTATGLPS